MKTPFLAVFGDPASSRRPGIPTCQHGVFLRKLSSSIILARALWTKRLDVFIRKGQRESCGTTLAATERLELLQEWMRIVEGAQHITQRYTLTEFKEAAEIDPDLLRSCCPDEG